MKTELLVFLTPRVVRDEDEARRLRDESVNKVDPSTKSVIQQHIPPPNKGTGTPPPATTGGGNVPPPVKVGGGN